MTNINKNTIIIDEMGCRDLVVVDDDVDGDESMYDIMMKLRGI